MPSEAWGGQSMMPWDDPGGSFWKPIAVRFSRDADSLGSRNCGSHSHPLLHGEEIADAELTVENLRQLRASVE